MTLIITTKEIIERFKIAHGDKYGYDKVEYVNAKTKVLILCKKCDEYFEQLPCVHSLGRGCPYCGGSKNLKLKT